jgi:DNA-binding response OmpR family regulator
VRRLIAKDDKHLQAMLRLILAHAGYEATVADDGEQAWHAFQQAP